MLYRLPESERVCSGICIGICRKNIYLSCVQNAIGVSFHVWLSSLYDSVDKNIVDRHGHSLYQRCYYLHQEQNVGIYENVAYYKKMFTYLIFLQR